MEYSVMSMIPVDKISSPVTMVVDGKEYEYRNGEETRVAIFETRHTVETLYAKEGKIVVVTKEIPVVDFSRVDKNVNIFDGA